MIILYILQTTRCFSLLKYHMMIYYESTLLAMICVSWNISRFRLFEIFIRIELITRPKANKIYIKPSCDEKQLRQKLLYLQTAISIISEVNSDGRKLGFFNLKKNMWELLAGGRCWRLLRRFYDPKPWRNGAPPTLFITLSNHWLNPSEWWGMSTSFHHIPSFAKPPRWSTWSQSTGIGSTPFRKTSKNIALVVCW